MLSDAYRLWHEIQSPYLKIVDLQNILDTMKVLYDNSKQDTTQSLY